MEGEKRQEVELGRLIEWRVAVVNGVDREGLTGHVHFCGFFFFLVPSSGT